MTIELAITIGTFLSLLLGMAMKYATDMQALKSKNEWQDSQFEKLEQNIAEDKARNYEQHKEFYAHNEGAIKMRSDIEHIVKSIDEIKGILETRRREDK